MIYEAPPLGTDPSTNDTVPRRIFWTTFGVGLISIATILMIVLWVTSETNKVARENAIQQISGFLAGEQRRLAVLTADYAHWDSAYKWFHEGDEVVMYDNFGSGAGESDGFDLIYLIWPDGTPAYAYASNVFRSDLSRYNAEVAQPYLDTIVAKSVKSFDVVTGFAKVGDKYGIVAATRLRPGNVDGLTEADLPVMVAAKFMDKEAVAALQSQLLMQQLTLVGPDHVQSRSALYVPIHSFTKDIVGHVQIVAPQPGTALLQKVLPVMIVLVIVMLIGSWFAGQASLRQTRAYLQEHDNARTDELTGVLNRKGLADVIKQRNVQAALDKGQIALLYVDLNKFKYLNDTIGHDAGDTALQITAERLRASIRGSDYIARLGGDEFLCLIKDSDPQLAVREVATRLKHLTMETTVLGDQTFEVTAALGISVSKPGSKWDALLTQADTAMYHAKKNKIQDGVYFTDEMARSA